MIKHITGIFFVVAIAGTLMIGNILGPAYAGAPGFWTAGAPMIDPRTSSGVEGAAASEIAGKIYVSHGYRFGDRLFLSEYDIGTDSWTHGGAGLPDATVVRSEGAGAAVSGKHYSIGGRTGGGQADNEEFDPVAMSWTTKAPMPTARAIEHSVAVDSGKIYVIGGRTGGSPGSGGVLSTNEAYDVGTNTWTPLASLPTAVSDAAALSIGGKIYVFGGIDAAGIQLDLVQIYDIATDSWSAGAVMSTPRASLSAGMCGSQMHLMGGLGNVVTHEVYNPITNSWSADTVLPTGISEVQGVSAGGKIYLIGSGAFGLSGSSNQIWTCAVNVIGGELLPIDSTALMLAGLQSSAIWMLPVLAGVAGVGAFYIKTRMNKD